MKKKVSILSVCLLSFSLMAQITNPQLRAYYELTNKAEIAILDSNYRSALNYYQQAFETCCVATQFSKLKKSK